MSSDSSLFVDMSVLYFLKMIWTCYFMGLERYMLWQFTLVGQRIFGTSDPWGELEIKGWFQCESSSLHLISVAIFKWDILQYNKLCYLTRMKPQGIWRDSFINHIHLYYIFTKGQFIECEELLSHCKLAFGWQHRHSPSFVSLLFCQTTFLKLINNHSFWKP